MLDLYTWPTPNGHKVHIMLEELGVDYRVVPIDIWAGEQFSPDFLRISPNNKMPALVDNDGPDGAPISIFESGAILLYLTEKHRRFMPQDPRGRWEVVQWLMFQMSAVGTVPRTGPPLPRLRAREDRLRDRPLHERGGPYLPRPRPAARGPRVPRGRVLDRGHRDLPVAALARAPGADALRFPERGAMVPRDRAPTRGRARRPGARGPAPRRPPERGGARQHVRGEAVREEVSVPRLRVLRQTRHSGRMVLVRCTAPNARGDCGKPAWGRPCRTIPARIS